MGPLAGWSGLETKDHDSWLIDHAEKLGFNALWFSPMNAATAVEKMAHGKKLTGSYYAIRDHFKLDSDFSTGDAAKDKKHMQFFCQKAESKGIRVFADLVFNHVAADHPLVLEEDRQIQDALKNAVGTVRPIRASNGKLTGIRYTEDGVEKGMHFLFRRNDDLNLKVGGPAEDRWSDVAQINYSSPAAREFFITGRGSEKGYFKEVIDWHLDHGFTGFRCDAAYLIPPESWQELISYAHQQKKDLVFLAETLGGDKDKVERLSKARITDEKGRDRPAFDFGMLGFYWWDFKSDWLPKTEHPRLLTMSKYGGAGSPDNHDTAYTLAAGMRGQFGKMAGCDEAIAAVCLRNYTLSALAGNSFYVQMGFEYGNEKQNRVFRGMTSPADWQELQKRKGGRLDISEGIAAVNKLKKDMGVDNCIAHFRSLEPIEEGKAVRIHIDYKDADTKEKKGEVVLLLNCRPELGAVTLFSAQAPGLEAFGGEQRRLKDVLIYHSPLPKTPAPVKALKPIGKAPGL